MNKSALAPWLEVLADQLLDRTAVFPQSLLIAGQAGLGKSELAQTLALSLLCENPTDGGHACNQCQQCLLFRAGNHPDFHAVLTEKETMGAETLLSGYGMRYLTDNQRKQGKKTRSESILVDQIRSVAANVVSTPQLAERSVVMISPADSLNRNAANSLLKILEEPVKTTWFILVAHRLSALPATIRSRCQHIAVSLPPRDQAREWLMQGAGSEPGLAQTDAEIALNLTAGAPAEALKLSRSGFLSLRSDWLNALEELSGQSSAISTFANQWKKAGSLSGLLWLYGWVRDLALLKAAQGAGSASPELFNGDCLPKLQIQAKRLDLRQLMIYQGLVQERFAMLKGTNADDVLVLEEVLASWKNLFSER